LSLNNLKKNWNQFGADDPLWAVLTANEKRGRQWDVKEFFASGVKEIAEVFEQLEMLTSNLPHHNALDFGCGVGRLTQALASRFDSVTGVDIAPSMIEKAKEFNRHGGKCSFQLNQEANLHIFEDSSFDFIYSNITLQHMQPKYIRAYLTEFIRILNSNGVLVFQLPGERLRGNSIGKRIIRNLVPESWIDALFHWQIRWQAFLLGQPVMEMYGIPREKVIGHLHSINAVVLHSHQLPLEQSVWQSYRYYVMKGTVDKSTESRI